MSLIIEDREELSDDVKLQFNSDIRFTDFPLHYHLIEILLENGYLFPSPVQYHLLSQEIVDENILVQAKSGTGKTIAFILFILNKIFFKLDISGRESILGPKLWTLLIAPTREICIQINENISMFLLSNKYGHLVNNFCCIGGSSISEDLVKIHVKVPIILTSTPGRFIQLVNHNSLSFLSPAEIRESLLFLLFDEADRLFEDCFFEQTDLILEMCLKSPNIQFMAFSATFSSEKLQILKRKLKKIRNKEISDCCNLRQIQLCSSIGVNTKQNKEKFGGVYNKLHNLFDTFDHTESSCLYISKILETPVLRNLKFYLYDLSLESVFYRECFDENDYQQWSYLLNSIINLLIKIPYRQTFIFTNNGSIGYKITAALDSLGIHAMYTNGKRSQIEREQILTLLQKNICRVVVCSDLFARGIDINKVDLVINIDVPLDKETFLHRAGRSARFGQSGKIVCIPNSKPEYESFIYFFKQLGINYLKFSDSIYSVNDLNKIEHSEEHFNVKKPFKKHQEPESKSISSYSNIFLNKISTKYDSLDGESIFKTSCNVLDGEFEKKYPRDFILNVNFPEIKIIDEILAEIWNSKENK